MVDTRVLSRKCYENNTDGSGVLTSTWESVEGVRTTGVFVLIFDGIVTPTVTLLAKMLLQNQRRIQYKVTFFTREVTLHKESSIVLSHGYTRQTG